MNEEKTKHLLTSYPNLYSHPINFDCGDGWFDLIDRLSMKLEALINEFKLLNPDCEIIPYVTQVKEKYGVLCFYSSCFTDTMCLLIDEAEFESCHICEICGKEGKLTNLSWLQTLCDEHIKEVNEDI